MVNTLRLELWTPPPYPLPKDAGARRLAGPRYDLDRVKALADGDHIYVATAECDKYLLEKLEWDVDDVASLIRALRRADYHASEWCKVSNSIVIDADAYALRYD